MFFIHAMNFQAETRFLWFSIGNPYICAEWRFWGDSKNQKHQITPAKISISKPRFWNLFYIIRNRPLSRGKPLRTLFSSSEMSKITKKSVVFQPKPRFRMVFHGFPCQNFIHCSRHAYRGAESLPSQNMRDAVGLLRRPALRRAGLLGISP